MQRDSGQFDSRKSFEVNVVEKWDRPLATKVANPTLMSFYKVTVTVAKTASLDGSNRAPNSGGFECLYPGWYKAILE